MVRKREVMGFMLDVGTMRDSLLVMERYLNEDILNVVQIVNSAFLVLATSDEAVGDYLRGCDYTVVQDENILRSVDIAGAARLDQAACKVFFGEFIKRVYRMNRSVYLLAENEKDLTRLKDYLAENCERLKIIGEAVLPETSEEEEQTVNDINFALPDVVISVVSAQRQAQFVLAHREKCSAHLFIGAADGVPYGANVNLLLRLWRKFFGAKLFHRRVQEYNKSRML